MFYGATALLLRYNAQQLKEMSHAARLVAIAHGVVQGKRGAYKTTG